MARVLNLYLDESGQRHPSRKRGTRAEHGYDWFAFGGILITEEDEVSLRRLSGEPWIFWHREIASRVYDEIVSACAAAGFEPRVVQRTTRLSTVICLVASGLGITLVPASATMLHVAGIALREVHSPRIKISLSLITRSGHRAPGLSPFIAAVRDCARAVTKPARG